MLEINRKLAPGEVRKFLLSVVKREFNSCHYNILGFFFGLRQSRVGFMTFQTIDKNLQSSKAHQTSVILQPTEITLVKFTHPDQRPSIPSLSHYWYGQEPITPIIRNLLLLSW